ncbi:hypothetical protein ACHAXR_012559, partial [Thalassiosira sp. AJA248-18]
MASISTLKSYAAAAIVGLLMFGIFDAISPENEQAMIGNGRQLRQLSEYTDPKSVDLKSDMIHLQTDAPQELDDNEQPQKTAQSVTPYTLEQVLKTRNIYRNEFIVIIYDPDSDQFIPYYSNRMKRNKMAKTMWVFNDLTNSLRVLFPERFTKGAPEFALAIGGGDYPSISGSFHPCIMKQDGPCATEGTIGPILQFGSAYKAPVLPTMISMPMPTHLPCFVRYANGKDNVMVYGSSNDLGWDDLIPQVVWRGTDFQYLTNLYIRRAKGKWIGKKFRQPLFESDMAEQISKSDLNTKEAATNALENVYDDLLPRWKGVVWTARSEVEAEHKQDGTNDVLPWANIKFATAHLDKRNKVDFNVLEGVGIHAKGERMSRETLARYKYHIDIGGGGGTTWSGTLQKLAMPGLLFHHETPMKDYFYGDWMVPWEHYVPVKEDLKDLKEKYDWAESNPDKARYIETIVLFDWEHSLTLQAVAISANLIYREIAENGRRLVRSLGTREGFQPFFDQFYRDPLRQ